MNVTPEPPRRVRLPPLFFAVVGVAGLAFAAGAMGLFAPHVLPALGSPGVAWSCLGAGALLDMWAAAMVFTAARERQVHHGPPATRS